MNKQIEDKIKAAAIHYVEHEWTNDATPWSDYEAGARRGYELAKEGFKDELLLFLEFRRKQKYFKENGSAITEEEIIDKYLTDNPR